MADNSVTMDETQPCRKHSLLSSISSRVDFELCSNCSDQAEFDVCSDHSDCAGQCGFTRTIENRGKSAKIARASCSSPVLLKSCATCKRGTERQALGSICDPDFRPGTKCVLMKVILELQDQPSNVRRVTVRHDIVIGRGSDCNLRLSAPQVSRRHCFLRVGREGVSVTDLDSSNGTYVDGKRIKPGKRYDLNGGSALAVGPIKFVVHIREEVVVAEILKNGTFNQADDSDSGARDSEYPIAAGNFDVNDAGDTERPMNLAVEQGGASSDSHEPTEEMHDDADLQPEAFVRSSRQRPELLDSRAEIIDLGRRIAELDAQVAARNASADTLRTKLAGKPAEQPAAADDHRIPADLDLLQVLDDEMDVVVIDDSVHGEAVVTEDEVIEVVDELVFVDAVELP